ncbi:phosphotransferase family protein [Streptomyces sp. NPDC102467]|uniref:phosphotransferase family protein n=1 Tax=Streptomyces sp. NPDC102467 TaxID=3366179 RepID=UPI0038064C5B
MTDLRQAHGAARAIAAAALGRDVGPMATAESNSHHVYVGSHAVVKIIESDGHVRLNRETALAPHLPARLTARLLDSGLHRLGTLDIRYACYARAPGASPGIGLPGTDGATARSLARAAVRQLGLLHSWSPSGSAERILRESPGDGGFTGQAALFDSMENLAALDRHGTVPRRLLDGLRAIAEHAPPHARSTVPVHADCHWGNWLVDERNEATLLDFEWARFGEPADDWFFLARFSGPHTHIVLDAIAEATTSSVETLRAECEIREAAHLASDLCLALEHPDTHARIAADRLRALDELIIGRFWWRHTR